MKERLEGLKSILKSGESALITGDTNRLYFTGFESSAGCVLVTKNKAFLLIDFRYYESAKRNVTHMDVVLSNQLYSQISEILKNECCDTVYIETDVMTLEYFEKLKEKLSGFTLSCEDTLSEYIKESRSIKSEDEIKFIESAQKLTDEAFQHILNYIKPGVSEIDIALELEFYMRKNGSEGVAFDFIVVSGKNSSLPHGVPTQKQIQNGDFVTLDFGGVCSGYRSDMTRTVAVENITDKQYEVYNTVLFAQKSALEFIKSGVECCEVDKVARDIIKNAGYGDCFGHGLGHSVGLDIHETPACNTSDKTVLKPGMIMTVEPGIYIENEFGVRIEDMVAVTKDTARNLTFSPKELIIL